MNKNKGLGALSGSSSLRSPEPVPVSAHSGDDPARKSDLDEAYEIVGEMLGFFDRYTLATFAPLAAIVLRERRETITRFLRHEIDINGSVEPIKPTVHTYNPHRKWPWFCADCGYPEHEQLKHPLRDRDATLRRREAAEGEALQPGPSEETASPESSLSPYKEGSDG